MPITSYQTKYLAHELTLKLPSGSSDRVNAALVDARVELNPHQVEAALFAFKSPLSKGCILADEVGLGKTIEAGIVLAQLWAERKRRLLIICPANLRKQWSQELYDKFYLPTKIIERKLINQYNVENKRRPFEQPEIVIISYQVASSFSSKIAMVDWDLVVIDEAHRLRNSYKESSKLGNNIKQALNDSKKVLLIATPLQNSLMELFGLVSIIDNKVFGNEESFRKQFSRINDDSFADLKARLSSICIRTLRRQVQEFIRFTKRIPLTVKFTPSVAEKELYDRMNEFLQRENLFALPNSQRHFTGMLLRKLMASSSFALADTIANIIKRLETSLSKHEKIIKLEEFISDFDDLDNEGEEWLEEYQGNDSESASLLSKEDEKELRSEIEVLKSILDLSRSIVLNNKGAKLLEAVNEGFKQMQPGAPKKAIIFTESTRTQTYLKSLLDLEYPGKVVLFNGCNNDEDSVAIYKAWLAKNAGTDKVTNSPTADKKAALVEFFRNEAVIMIATEAGAEGINLQFCSLVINYDLPWNPQRIEQRIGRCHRYGQQHDVVVVNFLNEGNKADIRVFELLEQKFKLFDGVFGTSDEVLGSIESGVDFVRRVANIYQTCRTEEEIDRDFSILKDELAPAIDEKLRQTRDLLFANLDSEVIDRLNVRKSSSKVSLTKFEDILWEVTKFSLFDFAVFSDQELSFELHNQPFNDKQVTLGTYKLGTEVEGAIKYRIGGDLAQNILDKLTSLNLDTAELNFMLSLSESKVSDLEPLKGNTGIMRVDLLSIDSFEHSEHLVFTALNSDGNMLEETQVQKMLGLPAELVRKGQTIESPELNSYFKIQLEEVLNRHGSNDIQWYHQESEKIDKWADDRKREVQKEIDDLKQRVKEIKAESKLITKLDQLSFYQEKIKDHEAKLSKKRREIDAVEDKISEERDMFLHEIKKRLNRTHSTKNLFTIQWRLT